MIHPNDIYTFVTRHDREVVIVIERHSKTADVIRIFDADIYEEMMADMEALDADE